MISPKHLAEPKALFVILILLVGGAFTAVYLSWVIEPTYDQFEPDVTVAVPERTHPIIADAKTEIDRTHAKTLIACLDSITRRNYDACFVKPPRDRLGVVWSLAWTWSKDDPSMRTHLANYARQHSNWSDSEMILTLENSLESDDDVVLTTHAIGDRDVLRDQIARHLTSTDPLTRSTILGVVTSWPNPERYLLPIAARNRHRPEVVEPIDAWFAADAMYPHSGHSPR